tara:strand:+ start:63 stop:263 length:201 start_codon:yes stop_codon:yes gene_type:complete
MIFDSDKIFDKLENDRLTGVLQKTIEDDNVVLYSSGSDQNGTIIRHQKSGETEVGTFEYGVFTALN